MSNREILLADLVKAKKENRHLAKDVHSSRNKLAKIYSWLKVYHEPIWKEFEKYEEEEARKIDSNEIKK